MSRYALFPPHDHPDKADRWLRCAGSLPLALPVLLVLMVTPSAVARGLASTAVSTPPSTAPSDSSASSADTTADGAASADETLFLEVDINGQSTGKIGEFIVHRGKLMARVEELRDLGLRVPESRGPHDVIPLSDIPGLTYALDGKNQQVHVTVSESRLVPTQLEPLGRTRNDDRRTIESGTGATMNYDVVDTITGGQTGATGAIDLRGFSPLGVVSSGWLAYAGGDSNGSNKNTAIRLDSSFTYADINTLRRYSLGDFITGGLAWTRPVRLSGAQIRSDFSMRPDLVTFPLPSVTGSAAVPSTVNILADGNVVVSSQTGAGPFQTPQLPVMSGAGTITVSVTNAMGQQVTMTQPFYASSALLSPGLQTFAVQAGLARLNWGIVSNEYGKMAGTAVYRRGLTSKFTVEGAAEGTPGATMAGAGGVFQIGNLGVINFAAAGSAGSAGPGGQLSAGAQRIGRVFSLGASAMFANRNYRDVASMNGDGVARKQLSAFTSLSLRRFGSAGVAYGGFDQDPSPVPIHQNAAPAQHNHVVSANYSLQIRHVSIYASEYRNFTSSGGSSGLQVGLTIPFGRRSSASVSATSDGYGQVQVEKPVTEVGEWGYYAYLSAGAIDHEFAEVQHKSSKGLFTAGIDSTAGQMTMRMESQGALSFVDRSLFASNAIYDSFAVVDTGPMAHVHVLQENRDVGRTNSSGRLLVPDMRSFDVNHITIEPTDIPADATINDPSRVTRPQDRSGVVVKFAVKISHGALLQLVDDAGAPLAVGSTATLRSTGVTVPVGYEGEAYVEDLGPHNVMTVERTDGQHCTVLFDYRAVRGEIPKIGPLRCVGKKP